MTSASSDSEPTAEMGPSEPLIPGLPDEVAEECLLRLPSPHAAVARSVSASWRRVIRPALPHLFVFAARPSASPRRRLLLLALDPLSRRWLPLSSPPTPPLPLDCLASAALPHHAQLLLLGGGAALTYRAATNSWSAAAQAPVPAAYAARVGGQIYTAGCGSDGRISSMVAYDPEAGLWSSLATLPRAIERYDSAALGRTIYITEGWTWPFTAPPRGAAYDVDQDTWTDMATGMAEGWTGAAAAVGPRILVISETGEGRAKVYDAETDTWRSVSGGGVLGAVRKPFVVAGAEETVFVVGRGLDVGMGKVAKDGTAFRASWEVVKGPPGSADLHPISAHVLYV